MADKKISALTGASTPLAGTEVLPIVQGGSTVKVSVANLTAGRSVSTGPILADSGPGGTSSFSSVTYSNVGIIGTSDGRTGGGSQLNFTTTGHRDWVVGQRNDAAYAADSAFFIRDETAAATRLTIGTTGDLSISGGNLIPGTAAKGVNFTANTPAAGMTSQLLNWYEEGTWTPVISENGAGSVTFTATTQSGRYTRIGRQVTIICEYTYTNRGSVAGSYAFMTGLPFTSGGKSFVDIAIQQAAPDVSLYTAYLAGSSTTIQFWKNNYPGAAGAMLGTDFPVAGSVVFCMTYFV